MHVQFEFTQDDLIDVSKRVAARLKTVRAFHLKVRLATSLLTGLVIFLIAYRTPLKATFFGLVGALLAALLYPGSAKRGTDKQMRRIAKEIFGDVNSFLCEVELRPDGVWVRQMDHQILYEWPSVEEIRDSADSVEVLTRDGSGIVVRNRAFSSPEERLRFIELARAAIVPTNSPQTSRTIQE